METLISMFILIAIKILLKKVVIIMQLVEHICSTEMSWPKITALTKSVHKSPVKMFKNLFLWSTPKNYILEMGNSLKDFEVEIILMNISNAYEHTLSLFAIVTLLCMFKCKEAAIPRDRKSVV